MCECVYEWVCACGRERKREWGRKKDKFVNSKISIFIWIFHSYGAWIVKSNEKNLPHGTENDFLKHFCPFIFSFRGSLFITSHFSSIISISFRLNSCIILLEVFTFVFSPLIVPALTISWAAGTQLAECGFNLCNESLQEGITSFKAFSEDKRTGRK